MEMSSTEDDLFGEFNEATALSEEELFGEFVTVSVTQNIEASSSHERHVLENSSLLSISQAFDDLVDSPSNFQASNMNSSEAQIKEDSSPHFHDEIVFTKSEQEKHCDPIDFGYVHATPLTLQAEDHPSWTDYQHNSHFEQQSQHVETDSQFQNITNMEHISIQDHSLLRTEIDGLKAENLRLKLELENRESQHAQQVLALTQDYDSVMEHKNDLLRMVQQLEESLVATEKECMVLKENHHQQNVASDELESRMEKNLQNSQEQIDLLQRDLVVAQGLISLHKTSWAAIQQTVDVLTKQLQEISSYSSP